MGANDSKHCDGDVGSSQGMCALQAERDKGRGKRRRVGRREECPFSVPALLYISAEPPSAVLPGRARALKGYIVSEQRCGNLLVVGKK